VAGLRQTRWVAHSAPLDPLAVFTEKGMERREKGRGKVGKGGGRKGEEEEGREGCKGEKARIRRRRKEMGRERGMGGREEKGREGKEVAPIYLFLKVGGYV